MPISGLSERAPAVAATSSSPAPASPLRAERSSEPSAFSKMLRALGHEMNVGEKTVKEAIDASKAGRDLGATELLALQAGVYRYGEAVDLAAKLVDRAATGVKTVVQGQGQ